MTRKMLLKNLSCIEALILMIAAYSTASWITEHAVVAAAAAAVSGVIVLL
jgi:hypothetical protein